VISTSSKRNVLEEMGMAECFSGELYLPNIQTVDEVTSVLSVRISFLASFCFLLLFLWRGGSLSFVFSQQLKVFAPEQQKKAVELLGAMGADQRLSIGIKKLLMLIEMAKQDKGRELEKFVDSMQEHVGR